MKTKIQTKRIYEKPSPSDGRRILVDRLWPRGLSKDAAQIDYWAKAIAPSQKLRQWYQHDPKKWDTFRQRYFAEINTNPQALKELSDQMASPITTLLFSSKEQHHNNATALCEYLQQKTFYFLSKESELTMDDWDIVKKDLLNRYVKT